MLLSYLLPINLSHSAFAIYLNQQPSAEKSEILEAENHHGWQADPEYLIFRDEDTKNSSGPETEKRNSNPFENAFQEAGYHLDYMTRKLSFFVNDTDFDHLAFEYWSEDYKVYLSDSNVVAKLADFSKDLQDKLAYSRFLYKVMAETNEDFNRFGDRVSLSFIIFYQMAVLKLRALLLLLPQRKSHPKASKLVETVLNIRHDISFLHERFSKLGRIPVDIRLRFDEQVKLAREVVSVIGETMLKKEKS